MNRPKWFDYIRVRQRTNLSTKTTDFVASFGPRNILTPENMEERMAHKLEAVKDWLWNFMQRELEAGAASHNGQGWADFKTIDRAISDLGELAGMLREKHNSTGFDGSIALRLEQISQTLKSVEPLPAPPSEANGPQEGK